jgi:hypothetical protein
MNRYMLIDLGGLVAGGTCFPGAVQLVGEGVQATGNADTSGPALDPFLYSGGYHGGSMSDLGISSYGGFGMAINRLGDIAGALSPNPGAALSTAFVRKAGGALIFPGLPGELVNYPLSINDSADIAGRYVPFSGPAVGGWYCLDGEPAVDLATVNRNIRRASQINNARKVVGEMNDGTFFVYDVTAQSPGALPQLTSAFLSEDHDIFINNSGLIAANTVDGPVYVQGNNNTLPMAAPPTQASVALGGLNDSGQVFFNPVNNSDDQGNVFLSDQMGPYGSIAPAIYNLNDYLDAPGWKVTRLTGIASDGTLVGIGVLGGDTRGILLLREVPTPHIPWTAAFVKIVFGIIQDGGGVEIPGGPVPPWDPLAMAAASLNAGQKDVLTAFAINLLAGRIVDSAARHDIQVMATRLIEQAAPRMNARASFASVAAKAASGTRERPSARDPQRFLRFLQAQTKQK